jgi:hypothetical protein
MLNVSLTSTTSEQLERLCTNTIENSQDFTDSIYISIEQRERVLEYHRQLHEQLDRLIQHLSISTDVCFDKYQAFELDHIRAIVIVYSQYRI